MNLLTRKVSDRFTWFDTADAKVPLNEARRTEALETAEPDRLLRPSELRTKFGVAGSTLREWDADGTLPAAQRTGGGHRRWLESQVRAKLAELRTGT